MPVVIGVILVATAFTAVVGIMFFVLREDAHDGEYFIPPMKDANGTPTDTPDTSRVIPTSTAMDPPSPAAIEEMPAETAEAAEVEAEIVTAADVPSPDDPAHAPL